MSLDSSFLMPASVLFCLACANIASAQDKPSIVFPEVDGWARNIRYDPPAVPATSIAYTTKAKVGQDYIRAQIAMPKAGGKMVADVLPEFEKKILDNPVHKKMMKAGTKEVKFGATTATQVTFHSDFFGPAETTLIVAPAGAFFVRIEFTTPAENSEIVAKEAAKMIEAVLAAAAK